MNSSRVLAPILAGGLIVLLAIGCGGSGSPTAPDPGSPGMTNQARTAANGPHESCWGLYDVVIDPATSSVDIVPLRGALFEANVTKFLHPPIAPVNLLTITVQPETDFPSGYVVVNVGIRHPFPGTNLRGFDVLGVFMPPEGGYRSAWDPALTYPSNAQARLLNADGYTRWWNQVEFTTFDTIFGYTEGRLAVHGFESTCTLNPFKYFADGLGPKDPFDLEHLMATDRGSFDTANPGFNSRRYEIQFAITGAVPDWRFKYAVTSSYWGPDEDVDPPAQTEDFPLTANRAEAVQISVQDAGSWAFWENESTYGGDLVFNLQITDWQGMNFPPGTPSEIGGVYAESPTLFEGVVDLMDSGMIAWEPPSPTLSLVGCTIPDVTPDGIRGQYLLIIVTSADPTDYSVQLPDVSGFDYPEDAVLAAFTLWEVPISPVGPHSCEQGPNLMCTGDGNIFVDAYVVEADNAQLFRNIINFDLGGPNSYNTVVKYYTGHGGTHNNSPINVEIAALVAGEGYTLVDTSEEPIDTTDCRIIFICLPGYFGGSFFTQEEFDTLNTFIDEGGRIVLTQEYNDSAKQIQWGNDILDALGSSIDRLNTTTAQGLFAIPNECYAITHDVDRTFNPAYTSFELGAGDMSFIDDDENGWHVLVGDWL